MLLEIPSSFRWLLSSLFFIWPCCLLFLPYSCLSSFFQLTHYMDPDSPLICLPYSSLCELQREPLAFVVLAETSTWMISKSLTLILPLWYALIYLSNHLKDRPLQGHISTVKLNIQKPPHLCPSQLTSHWSQGHKKFWRNFWRDPLCWILNLRLSPRWFTENVSLSFSKYKFQFFSIC